MIERPIVFSAPMVQALVAGRKTQTRRLAWRGIKVREDGASFGPLPSAWWKVRPGDRLWVRETVRAEELPVGLDVVRYRATDTWQPILNTPEGSENWLCLRGAPRGRDGLRIGPWRPAIHMPRWCSRIRLDVTDVRIERLQAIGRADALAEGIQDTSDAEMERFGIPGILEAGHPVRAFSMLWDSLHGAGAWDSNPEVIVLTFAPTVRIIAMEHA